VSWSNRASLAGRFVYPAQCSAAELSVGCSEGPDLSTASRETFEGPGCPLLRIGSAAVVGPCRLSNRVSHGTKDRAQPSLPNPQLRSSSGYRPVSANYSSTWPEQSAHMSLADGSRRALRSATVHRTGFPRSVDHSHGSRASPSHQGAQRPECILKGLSFRSPDISTASSTRPHPVLSPTQGTDREGGSRTHPRHRASPRPRP